MLPLTKVCAIAALLGPLASAKLSTDEMMAADAYALLLVRGEDPFDTELIGAEEPDVNSHLSHWRAVTDSVPGGIDRGQVTSAWASNLDKAKHSTEASAADELAFEKKVYNQRLFDRMATAEQLASIKRAVAASAAADSAAVAAAKSRSAAVHKAAAVKMARAAQAAEAHALKKAQAEAAALEGQTEGNVEGAEAAAAKRAAWNDQVAADAAERLKASESAHAAEDKAAERAAVNKRTSEIEAAEKQEVANALAAARASEAQQAAAAALNEDAINGDEDKKNTYTMHSAELSADSDFGNAKSDQEITDQASIGNWPAGRGGWFEEHR